MDPGKMETQIGQLIVPTDQMKLSRNVVLPENTTMPIVPKNPLVLQIPTPVQPQLMELNNGNVLMAFVFPSPTNVTVLDTGDPIVRIHQMKLFQSAALNLVNTHGGKTQTVPGQALDVKISNDL